MSRDRILHFDGKSVPTLDALLPPARAYLGDLLSFDETESTTSRVFLNLPGTFRRRGEEDGTPRYVEVVRTDDHVDVITRDMDGPANDIADGLARHLARVFKARLDPSDFPHLPMGDAGTKR